MFAHSMEKIGEMTTNRHETVEVLQMIVCCKKVAMEVNAASRSTLCHMMRVEIDSYVSDDLA